jgi:hypothetical protein
VRGVYEGMGMASAVGEGVVGEVAGAGVDWVTDMPPSPPVDETETEEAPESVRGRKSTSLLDPEPAPANGARSAKVEGYLRNADADVGIGNGGSPLSLSKCCSTIGASSGVTGIGRLMVDAVDGVSTASLPDTETDDNPLWRALAVADSGGLPRAPPPAWCSCSCSPSSGMLRLNEKAEPTLLVLVRPPGLAPPLAVRFCHDVGGSGGRILGPGRRDAAESIVSSCSLLLLPMLLSDRDSGCVDDLREDDDARLVRFSVESRRVNGDGASSSSLCIRRKLGGSPIS